MVCRVFCSQRWTRESSFFRGDRLHLLLWLGDSLRLRQGEGGSAVSSQTWQQTLWPFTPHKIPWWVSQLSLSRRLTGESNFFSSCDQTPLFILLDWLFRKALFLLREVNWSPVSITDKSLKSHSQKTLHHLLENHHILKFSSVSVHYCLYYNFLNSPVRNAHVFEKCQYFSLKSSLFVLLHAACCYLTLIVSLYVASGSDVGGNWEAVDAKSPNPDSRFYLNVCHKIIQTGGAAGCPVNSSICAVGKSLHKDGGF